METENRMYISAFVKSKQSWKTA